jgi:polygalacturonase
MYMRIKTFVIIFVLLLPCGGSAYSHIEVANTHDGVRNEFVNVKGYGAIGDGLIDDTNAIQSAIDSGAKHKYLPVGKYLVKSLTIYFM